MINNKDVSFKVAHNVSNCYKNSLRKTYCHILVIYCLHDEGITHVVYDERVAFNKVNN